MTLLVKDEPRSWPPMTSAKLAGSKGLRQAERPCEEFLRGLEAAEPHHGQRDDDDDRVDGKDSAAA